jgi:hypothetical protein
MPTVLRTQGYRFFFYSLEGSEPRMFTWSTAIKSQSFGCNRLLLRSPTVFNRVRIPVIEHRLKLLEAWNAHFSR